MQVDFTPYVHTYQIVLRVIESSFHSYVDRFHNNQFRDLKLGEFRLAILRIYYDRFEGIQSNLGKYNMYILDRFEGYQKFFAK